MVIRWARGTTSANTWNVPLRKVLRVLVKRIVAAEDVDESQDNLVRCVVHIYSDPANTFVATAEVDFVEDLAWSQLSAPKYASHLGLTVTLT